MRICPICHKPYSEPPALSRKDNKTEICSVCGTEEALEAVGMIEGSSVREAIVSTVEQNRKKTPYERTRDQVYATGNKWAIENFNATHN